VSSFSHDGAKASLAVAIGIKMLETHKHVIAKITNLRVSLTNYLRLLLLSSLRVNLFKCCLKKGVFWVVVEKFVINLTNVVNNFGKVML
jgi:hypothetical protein